MKRGRGREDQPVAQEEEGDEEEREEAPYDKLFRSLGVESSSSSDSSSEEEGAPSGSEEEDEDEEEEEVLGEEAGDNGEAEASEKIDQEEVDDDAVEPVDESREQQAPPVDARDPFARIFCREHDDAALKQVPGGQHKTVGRAGSARLLSTVALPEEVWLAPSVNDWVLDRSELQSLVLRALGSYCDLTIPGVVGAEQRSQMRDAYALHLVNHILKSRNTLWSGNCRLRSGAASEVRDQGFRRCKTLVLAPMRGDAYDIVRRILSFTPQNMSVQNLAKFEELCAAEDVEIKRKPQDYVERFSLNTDDSFAFGVRFNYESIRLCTGFDNCDLIVASPLGLRTIIGTTKKAAADFLSSIEVAVLDCCEVLAMQNWEHLEAVLRACNQIPREIGSADISRLMSHHLNGLAKHVRQTIALSEVVLPELNALMRRLCCNVNGSAFLREKHRGVLEELDSGGVLRLVFQKSPVTSLASAGDEKYEYFAKTLLPRIAKNRTGLLVYVPSYFDFLKLRKLLNELEIPFAHLCEYTTRQDVNRDRKDFDTKVAAVMLYTERRHFFYRMRLPGMEHVLFYGLPTLPRWFVEMVNCIKRKRRGAAQVVVLYNSLDKFGLERVVGSERAEQMLASEKTTHMFLT